MWASVFPSENLGSTNVLVIGKYELFVTSNQIYPTFDIISTGLTWLGETVWSIAKHMVTSSLTFRKHGLKIIHPNILSFHSYLYILT